MSEEQITYEFNKNTHELVRAGFSNYNGKVYAFIRIFYNASPDVENPDWRPSKKGITINVDLLPKLIEAVESLKES